MDHQAHTEALRRQMETIEKLTTLLERVSPTPWSANPMGIVLDADGGHLVREADGNMFRTDAELAALAPTLAQEVLTLAEKLLEERNRTEAVLFSFKVLRDELLARANELYADMPDDGDSGYNPGDSVTNAAMKINEVLERFKPDQPLPKPAPQVVYTLEALEALETRDPTARLLTTAYNEASLWSIPTVKRFAKDDQDIFPAVVVTEGEQIHAAVETLEALK